ncbi:MAG: MFS transporter [Novosphingobium sp.]|nr:MFS transporter [Novosphingobium sp.]
MPLLVLLLPRRVEALAGDDATLALSRILLTGALVASVANIAAGALSDRSMRRNGSRRVSLVFGIMATMASYVLLAAADGLPLLVAAVICFQIGLNATLSPLSALLTDYFRDDEKGRIAGLANAALPLSSAAVAPLAWLFPSDGSGGFLFVAVIAAACCAPLVVLWPFGRAAGRSAEVSGGPHPVALRGSRRNFALAWLARFLVQLGATFVFGYLYVFVAGEFGAAEHTCAGSTGERVGVLTLAATVLAMLAALASGRISDRLGRRRLPLALAALAAALALAVLGSASSWFAFIAAYALFNAALAGFLAVDTALVAEMLAADPRRAALLGIMNLTNTLPAVLAPGIALLVLDRAPPVFALAAAFTACAFGCAVAALAVLFMRNMR